MSFIQSSADNLINPIGATNGQALVWNSTLGVFEPATISGGGGGSSPAINTDLSLNLPDVNPATPTGNNVVIYSDKTQEIQYVRYKDQTGIERDLQSHIGTRGGNIFQLRPTGSTTTVNTNGLVNTTFGTATARTAGATSYFTSRPRIGFATASTAGATAGTRNGTNIAHRGNGIPFTGGYKFIAAVGISQNVSGSAFFTGLRNDIAAIGNVEPTTLVNCIGLSKASTETTMHIIHNDGAGSVTSIDLGASFPATTSNVDMYELTIYAPQNASAVSWKVVRLNTGDTASGLIITDMPAGNTMLGHQVWICNRATAAQAIVDVAHIYMELS
jgi:hypothetical protein